MFNKQSTFWFLIANSIVAVFSFKFPLDIERCPAGDTDCITKTANNVLKLNAKLGHRGINLLPVDPLHIPNIVIKQGADSPVNIELAFKDVNLIGLSKLQFTKFGGFQKDPAGEYLISLKGPALDLIGPYKISGRVLVLPIQGVGDSNIRLYNPDITIKFTGKAETRNGNEYLSIVKSTLTFTVSKLHFDFKNLYNGDKALGDSTNLFLNENWQDIFKEIKQNIFDAFTLIAENVLKNVFNKVPYKDLFSE